MPAVSITLEGVTKRYGSTVAVDNVSLKIEKGEFFTILGPSGCGKTTTLRIVAGFEAPDAGRVYFDDEDVTYKKPYERDTAMVFQNYALWPHMTVFENVAYGLRIRKRRMGLSEEDIRRMVREALAFVRLEGLENRYPLQLSGGQQQRVALARALVVQPKVLLLDEPLSNLDAKLRTEMRGELKEIQRKLGITTVYVTHDQVEAMSLSDRMAVMDRGKVLQVGTPEELYFRPQMLFVADFLGRSNIFEGEVVGRGEDYVVVRVDELGLELRAAPASGGLGKRAAVVIRPEIAQLPGPRGQDGETLRLRGRVSSAMFIGDKLEAWIEVGRGRVLVYLPNYVDVRVGEELEVALPWRRIVALPPE
ncbi:MAG: ABC transporter ATP-binding protein [Desulfurococcaceae archaeon]